MFRFSIRDVLWLTVVVGLCLSWWQAHRRSMDQAGRLMHLRGNWEDLTAVGKERLGIHRIQGNAEEQKVEILIEVQPK